MGVVAVRTEHGHTLMGEYEELRAYLAAAAAAGQLTADGLLAQGRLADGRCYARVRLLEVAPQRRVRRGVVVAGALTAAVVVGVAGWAVYVVLAWLAAHLAVIVGTLIALAVLVGVSGPRVCKTVVTVIHRH